MQQMKNKLTCLFLAVTVAFFRHRFLQIALCNPMHKHMHNPMHKHKLSNGQPLCSVELTPRTVTIQDWSWNPLMGRKKSTQDLCVPGSRLQEDNCDLWGAAIKQEQGWPGHTFLHSSYTGHFNPIQIYSLRYMQYLCPQKHTQSHSLWFQQFHA